MAARKYVSDYRLETRVAPDGRSETVRVYQGPLYAYCAGEEELRSLRKNTLLGAVLVIVGLLPLLFNNTQIGRTFYVAVPMAFSLLPWYLLAIAGWRLGKFQAPLTREQKDQTDKRLRLSAPWLTALLAVSFVGSIVYWILSGLQSGEWLCVAGMALSLLVSIYLLRLRKNACTRQIEAQ